MDQSEILRALSAAVEVVDDRRDSYLSEQLGVVAAIFRYLLDHPAAVPRSGDTIDVVSLIAALERAWPEERGADWIADAIEGTSPEAADLWRDLDFGIH